MHRTLYKVLAPVNTSYCHTLMTNKIETEPFIIVIQDKYIRTDNMNAFLKKNNF